MTKWLRFRDLQARGIVKSWAQLKRLIQEYGFPPGRMISPNIRVWSEEEEIGPWLKNRPVAGPEPRGAAKHRRERARKGADNTTATTA
jgi:hypothetical protein